MLHARSPFRRLGRHLLAWACLALAGLSLPAHAAPHIFVLHSYSQEYPWTKGQHQGFTQTLRSTGIDPVISTEYLDTKRRPLTDDYARRFADYLRFKYGTEFPDAIYVTDDAALEFARRHLPDIFPGSPVFFSGINNLKVLKELDPPRMTGVFEKKEIGPNIRLLRRMQKGLSHIVIVGDATPTHQAIEAELRQELQELQAFPDIQPVFLADQELARLLDKMQRNPAPFVFLTTVGGFVDGKGETIRLADAISAIAGIGVFAVVSMEDAYLQPGVLGGYVTRSDLQGAAAARMTKRYLDGTPLRSLPPQTVSPNGYVFDEQELRRHRLTLPGGIAGTATILNRSPSFYARHRQAILGTLYTLTTLVVLMMVGFLIALSRKNRAIRQASTQMASQAEQLEKARESLTRAQQIAHMGNWDLDVRTGKIYWSEGIFQLFGVDKADTSPSYELFLQRVHPDDRLLVEQAVQTALDGGNAYSIEHRVLHPDGTLLVVHEQAEVVRDEAGQSVRMIGTVQDVTATVRAREALEQREQDLSHLAHHDPLTGLPNRLMFNEQLEHAIELGARLQKQLAILFIDLDRFKQSNDSLGHAHGDALLKEVSQRIQRTLRVSDLSARLGGDEFVVLLDQIETLADAAHVAQKLLDAMQAPIQLQNQMIFTSISIGIAMYPRDGGDAVTLLRNADSAMYRSKEEGRNTFQFYDPAMTAVAMEKLFIEQGLRTAIKESQFQLHYQPQISLADGRLSAMEALLRWDRPDASFTGPDKFIPIAEDTGLIIPIGQWVLQQACTTMKRWLDAGLVDGEATMCVNVSRKQLKYAAFVELVTAILRDCGLPPGNIELEITEGTIMEDPALATQTLERLRQLGVRIAIDDFGTGYSSLSHLKTLPITTLKIDHSFVRDIPDDSDDASIAQAVIALARQMELEVVAEGIETTAQAGFLMQVGCPYGQGYLYGRPMPAPQFEAWVGQRDPAIPGQPIAG